MTVPELVGFIITILVLLIAMSRKMREEKMRREHPEKYAEKKRQEEEAFKAFLASLDLDVEEEPKPHRPPPPPKPRRKEKPHTSGAMAPRSTVAESFEFHSDLEAFKQRSRVEEREFQTRIDSVKGKDLISDRLQGKPKQEVYRPLDRPAESQARDFIEGLSTRQALLLSHDIFGPPKALQDES